MADDHLSPEEDATSVAAPPDSGEDLYRKDPNTGEFVKVGPEPTVEAPSTLPEPEAKTNRLLFPAAGVPFPEARAERNDAVTTPPPVASHIGGRRIAKRVLIGFVSIFVGLAILGAIINAVSGHKNASSNAPTTTAAPAKASPKPCSSFSAASRPTRCLTPAQRRARARLAARQQAAAARQARIAAKKAAAAQAKAQAQAAAAAAAQAAQVAAANAWHKGYTQQDDNVFWQWRNGGSCQSFATSGCWHVAVTTRDGCTSYVAVNANEYQGSAIVGSLLDNQGYGIPPKTVRVFELDADASGVTAGNVTINCN